MIKSFPLLSLRGIIGAVEKVPGTPYNKNRVDMKGVHSNLASVPNDVESDILFSGIIFNLSINAYIHLANMQTLRYQLVESLYSPGTIAA